jgi:hypothetical protein
MLLALADVQPGNKSHTERFRAQATPEIKSYSASIGVPCYGVALGDIISNTEGNEAFLFADIQQALSAHNIGIPVFAVYGNHDNCDFNESNPVFPDERNSTYNLKIQRAFEDTFGPADYSFNRGDVHIVTLRNTQYSDNTSTGSNVMAFTDEQYEWLQQDLALVQKDKMVVLCVHVPMFKYKNNTHAQDVLAQLDQFREAHILSGHLHYRKCYDFTDDGYGNIFEQSWSSCGAVANGNGVNIACDGAPIGYGVIVIRNGEMIKSIHKGYAHGMNDESYQIRLHRGGDITGAAISGTNSNGTKGYYQFPYENNVILANVFSSDPWNWTVEVWNYDEATSERTTKIGDMTSLSKYSQTPDWEKLIGSFTYEDPKRPKEGVESARDFWTIGITLGYLGKALQHNYHWNVCNTMWKYTLSEEYADAKIMVVARDKWGNEYTQTEFQVGTDFGDAIYNAANNPK